MMSNSNKEQKTPYGLYNQGATCYLNSILQLLFMTPNFHERLISNMKSDQELKTLFENLKEGPCRTDNITKNFQIQDVHKQHDAAEYLELVLNRISRPASKIFCGRLSYLTKCCKGHHINEETNPFWTLPVPLRDQNNGVFSVKRGLERILKIKRFTGENKAYCKDCGGNTEAEYKCELKDPPQVLVLLLKRFQLDPSTMSHIKSNCTVDIPTTLDIKGMNYDLYGIVHHQGILGSGHYTATIRSNNDKTWFEFNDNSVQKAKKQPSDPYSSDNAYLLAYTRGDETTAVEIMDEALDRTGSSPLSLPTQIMLIIFGVVILVIIFVLGLSLGLTRK